MFMSTVFLESRHQNLVKFLVKRHNISFSYLLIHLVYEYLTVASVSLGRGSFQNSRFLLRHALFLLNLAKKNYSIEMALFLRLQMFMKAFLLL